MPGRKEDSPRWARRKEARPAVSIFALRFKDRRHGIEDGIVKRCVEFTRFFRAEFRKTHVIVVKAVQSIQDLGAGLGQVAHKTKMIAETQREGTVCAGTRWDSDVG